MALEQISDIRSFGGQQQRFTHGSKTCNCDMTFAVYLPPAAEEGKVPVLYWLSGLTCTDENFVTKAGGAGLRSRTWRGDRRAGHQSPRRGRAGRSGGRL